MIFKFRENECLYQVLEILNKKHSTYGKIFRETKFSHTTLQKVLKYLIQNKFIDKTENNYSINEKGNKLFETLKKIKEILNEN